MFRILCDPSSGNTELRLTGITRSDSQIFCRVLVRSLPANLFPLSLEVNNFYIDRFLNFLLLYIDCLLQLGFVVLVIFCG